MGNIKIIPKHIDFDQEIKKLHERMCKEIAFVMAATGVRELNILGDATIKMEDKFTGDITDCKVNKVIRFGSVKPSNSDYGEVEVELNSFTYDYNINILHNQYVIPCSIEELYNTVFEKCVTHQKRL